MASTPETSTPPQPKTISPEMRELYYELDVVDTHLAIIAVVTLVITIGLSVIFQDTLIVIVPGLLLLLAVIIVESVMGRIGRCTCGHGLRWHEDKQHNPLPKCKVKRCNCTSHNLKA